MVCEKCGRVLLPGEICPCQKDAINQRNTELQLEKEKEAAKIAAEAKKANDEKIQKQTKVNEAVFKSKNIAADVSMNVISEIVDIFKNPIEGIQEFINEKNIINACVISIVSSLIFGLFGLAYISSFAVSLIFFLASIVGILGTSLGFFVVSKINKHEISIQDAFLFSIPGSVFVMPFVLIALILSALNSSFGLIAIIIALIARVSMDAVALSFVNNNKEKAPLYLTIVSSFNVLGIFITFSIFARVIARHLVGAMLGL